MGKTREEIEEEIRREQQKRTQEESRQRAYESFGGPTQKIYQGSTLVHEAAGFENFVNARDAAFKANQNEFTQPEEDRLKYGNELNQKTLDSLNAYQKNVRLSTDVTVDSATRNRAANSAKMIKDSYTGYLGDEGFQQFLKYKEEADNAMTVEKWNERLSESEKNTNALTKEQQKKLYEIWELQADSQKAFAADQKMEELWQELVDGGMSAKEANDVLNAQNQGVLKRSTQEELEYASDYIKQNLDETQKKLLNQYVAGNAEDKKEVKQQLLDTGISEEQFALVSQYGKELNDYYDYLDEQQKAYESVHTGSGVKDFFAGVGNTVGSILRSPIAGVEAMFESLNTQADPHAPINTYSGFYDDLNWSNLRKGATSQRIEESPAGKVGAFLYDTGVSAGESALNMALGGAMGGTLTETFGLSDRAARVVTNMVSLPSFGASAYSSTLQEAQNRGITGEDAVTTAVVAGLAEMATEVFSLDHFWDIAKSKGTKAARNAIIDLLAQAGIEGSEELASDVINTAADAIINGDQSAYNQSVREYMGQGMTEEEAKAKATKDTIMSSVESFLGGAISGGMMGGVASTVKMKSDSASAKDLFDSGDYAAFAEGIDTDANSYNNKNAHAAAVEAQKLAQSYADMQANGEEISTAQKRKLYNLVMDVQEIENGNKKVKGSDQASQSMEVPERTYEAADVPKGYQEEQIDTGEMINRMAEAQTAEQLASAYRAGRQTADATARTLADNAYRQYSGKLLSEGKISQEELDTALTRPTKAEAYLAGANGEAAEGLNLTAETKAAYNEGLKRRTTERASQTVQDVQEISGIKITGTGQKAKVTYNQKTVSAEDFRASDPGVQALVNYALSQNSEAATQGYLDHYVPGVPLTSYTRAYNVFHDAGASGIQDFQKTLEANKYMTSLIPEGTLKSIYNIGAMELSVKDENGQNTTVRKGTGTVKDMRKNKTESVDLMPVYEAYAKATGTTIVLKDDMDAHINGTFSKAANEIVFNTRSDKGFSTFFHEAVGEYTQAWNPEGMKEVQNAILSYVLATKGAEYVSGAGRRYQSAYIAQEGSKSFREAMDEYVNDSLGGLFSSEEGMQQFSEWLKKNRKDSARNVLQKIADWIKGVVDSLKRALKGSTMSEASRTTAQMNIEKASKLRTQVLDALNTASENRRKAAESTKASSQELTDEQVKYSVEAAEGTTLEERIQDALANPKEQSHIYIQDTPIKLQQILGIHDLPMLMTSNHIYSVVKTAKEARAEGNFRERVRYHGLGEKTLLEVFDSIREPAMIIKSNADPENLDLAVFTTVTDTKNIPVMVAIHPNGKGYLNALRIETNIILSAYGRENTGNYIEKALEENRILYVEQAKSQEIVQVPGIRSTNKLLSLDFTENLTRFREKVKENRRISFDKNSQAAETGDETQKITEEDSLGRILTKEQLDFFKNSKIRDENGNLKVMYHGTQTGGFTVFDSKKAKSSGTLGKGFYFTDSETHAGHYSAGGQLYEVYLNIENPVTTDGSKLTKSQLRKLVQELADNEDYGIENYGYDATVDSVLESLKGKSDFSALMDLNITCVGDMVETIKLLNKVAGTSYDGIITDIETVAFYPNQIKNTTNMTPTENEDIRLSIDVGLVNFAEDALKGKKGNWEKYEITDRIDERFAEDILKYTGVDASGFRNVITSDGVKHIEKRHGKDGEVDHSMANIAELGKVKAILETYDRARAGKGSKLYKNRDNTPAKSIELQKKIGDQYFYVIEAVPDSKAKTVYLMSMYINKNDTFSQEDNANSPTRYAQSEPESDVSFSKDSISNNPENASTTSDIRHSLDIDETLFDILDGMDYYKEAIIDENGKEQKVNDQQQSMNEAASILEEGNNLLQGKEVDKAAIQRIASRIRKDFGSNYDLKTFAGNLEKVFSYMQTQDAVDYNDMLRVMKEVAMPVVEASTDVVGVPEDYKAVRDYLGTYKIALNKEQKAEVQNAFGSYQAFKTVCGNRLQFSENGQALDSLWGEISEHSMGILDPMENSANQPLALYDMMEQLKPQKRTVYEGNNNDAAYDMALQIIEQYYEMEGKKSADKRIDRVKQKIRKQNVDYRAKVRQRYNERLKKARQDLAKRHKEQMSALREEKNQAAAEKIARLKARNRQSVIEANNRRKAAQERKEIVKEAHAITEMLLRPTDAKHVPENMKKQTIEFIRGIDLVSHRADEHGMAATSWREKMAGLQDILNRTMNNREQDAELESLRYVVDPDLSSTLNQWLGRNKNVPKVSEMEYEDLYELHQMLRAWKAAITNMNQNYKNARYETVKELGIKSFEELNKRKEAKNRTKAGTFIHNLLNVDMLDPFSYFEEMGEASSTVFDELREGFDTRVWHLKESNEYMESVLGKTDVSSWTGDKADTHTFKLSEGSITLTTAQIMSLYELQKRPQAERHILVGGIKAETIRKNGKELKQPRAVHVSRRELKDITGTLTSEQIRIADAMQEYMGTECAKWGNNVSMKMYGYEKFTEEHYFPIKTDQNTIAVSDQNNENGSYYAVQNISASKQLTPNANNPIMLQDIFDVFTNHVVQMATYDGMAMPISDAMRWFNYKEVVSQNTRQKKFGTMQEEIERVFGNKWKEYFKNFMKDINGMSKGGYATQYSAKFVSNYKGHAVGANIRVVIQQPTAYLRASAVMNPKYLAAATPSIVQARKLAREVREKSAIAWWKEHGYYDTSIGMTERQMITGISTTKDKIRDLSTKAAGIADDLTWGVLYQAVKLEQAAEFKKKGKPASGAEYEAACIKRFDYVVDHTQVVDSMFHRSQFMRSTDMLSKINSAFMAEPTKSYNMLHRAMMKTLQSGEKKHFARAAGTYILTGILTSAVAAVVDAFRDDDEEKEWMEKWVSAFSGNAIDNINPMNMIPILKEISSTLTSYMTGGYSSASSRMDLEGLISAAKAIPETVAYFKKLANGEDVSKTVYGILKNDAKAFSMLSGIPAYGAVREVETWYNALAEAINTPKLSTKTPTAAEKRRETYADYYRAVEAGEDTAAIISSLMEEGYHRSDILSALRAEYAATYKEAEGEEKENLKEKLAAALEGLNQDPETTLMGWETESADYEELDAAIRTGEGIKEAYEKLIQAGSSPESIKSHIQSDYIPDILYQKEKQPEAYEEEKQKLVEVLQGIGYENAENMVEKWILSGEKEDRDIIYRGLYEAIETGGDTDGEIETLLQEGTHVNDIVEALKAEYAESYLVSEGQEKEQMETRLVEVLKGLNIEDPKAELESWDTTGDLNYDALDKALRTGSGTEEAVLALLETGKEPESIKNHIRTDYAEDLAYRAQNMPETLADEQKKIISVLSNLGYEYADTMVENWKNGWTTTSGEKYGRLFEAVESGEDFQSAMQEALKVSGGDTGNISAAVTRQFKERFIETRDISLYNRLLLIYMTLGKTKKQAQNQILGWLEE